MKAILKTAGAFAVLCGASAQPPSLIREDLLPKRDDLEAEARWRMGRWWDETWCALPDPRNFTSGLLSGIPFGVIVVFSSARGIRTGDDLYDVIADPRCEVEKLTNGTLVCIPTQRGMLPQMLANRVNSYLLWQHPPWDASVQRDDAYIGLVPNDFSLVSLALPAAAHCRHAPTRDLDGMLLWPGLRQSIESIRKSSMEAIEGDISWTEKKSLAVWRGTATGTLRMPDRVHRIDFIEYFQNNPLFDVGLSEVNMEWYDAANYLPFVAGRMSRAEQLRHKIIISIDGNTCSSMTTWAFATKSVVAMVHPLAFEASIQYGLTPWVHFIPFSLDLSDLHSNVQWCFDNDEACRLIGERASRWVAPFLHYCCPVVRSSASSS